MNVNNVVSQLNKVTAIALREPEICTATSAAVARVKKERCPALDQELLQILETALAQTGSLVVRQSLIFFRVCSGTPNLYQFACANGLRKVRDFIAKNHLLPMATLHRTLNDGENDLSWAVENNDLDFVQSRLLAGEAVNTCIKNKSLLGIAASKGNFKMTDLILSFNPNIHLYNPLIHLAGNDLSNRYDGNSSVGNSNERYQVARILIQAGANVFQSFQLNVVYSYMLQIKAHSIDLEAAVEPLLGELLREVKQIKIQLFDKLPYLILGQKDPNSSFCRVPNELVWKIMDTALNTLVVQWAEEAIAVKNQI